MVNGALTLGGFAGVLISVGYLYWQVGRYAAPQVPTTRFDERKAITSYVAGLFVGVPIAVPFLFFLSAYSVGALPSVLLDVGIVVVATEGAQWAILRTVYFGSDGASPFYALGLRSGAGGILVVALVATYFSGPTLDAGGIGVTLLESVAVVSLEVTAALLALPRPPPAPARRLPGAVTAGGFVAIGLLLIGASQLLGWELGAAATLIALGGSWGTYGRLRTAILDAVKPAEGVGPPPRSDARFGRTDRDRD